MNTTRNGIYGLAIVSIACCTICATICDTIDLRNKVKMYQSIVIASMTCDAIGQADCKTKCDK